MNNNNHGKNTPTHHIEEAEKLYRNDVLVHATVETAAQLLELGVQSHTGEPMPNDHRAIARLAMSLVLYVQNTEPGLQNGD